MYASKKGRSKVKYRDGIKGGRQDRDGLMQVAMVMTFEP